MQRQLAAVRFTSPYLSEDPPMNECPVGYVLREAPWIYDLCDSLSLIENATPEEFGRMTPYARAAARLYRSEQVRLTDLAMAEKRQQSDRAALVRGARRG
jgi:hypothetical protein